MNEEIVEYFIKNLIFIAIAVVACFAYRFIINKTKLSKKSESKTLRYPIAYRLAPLIAIVYLGVIWGLVALFAPRDIIYVYAAAVMAAFGFVVFVARSLWRVNIKSDCFTVVSFFGVKHTYGYENLQLSKNEKGTKWIFFSGEITVFSLPFFIQDGDNLVEAYYSHAKQKSKQNQVQ